MSLFYHPHVRKASGWTTLYLGAVCALLVTVSVQHQHPSGLPARLLPAHLRGEIRWVTVRADQVLLGATVPAHNNVILHIPTDITRIARKVLFGNSGKSIRYWGYCFPKNAAEERSARRSGLPGKIFLSEREREHQLAEELRMRKEHFSRPRDLNEMVLNERPGPRGTIRHQKEIFFGGETCYVMTEAPLPVGTDADNDGANNKVEQRERSDPNNRDTDGDGLSDGIEIFSLFTQVTIRDTDADGLIDGVEDKNKNGRRDPGETSPLEWDSDHDGLCDGFCTVGAGVRTGYSAPKSYVPEIKQEILWEDKNLNGELDEGETDPLKVDTDGDGILDDQEFYVCQLSGGDCS